MKRKLILIILVFLFNILWVNAISVTNSFVKNNDIVIQVNPNPSNSNNIMDDLDVMLETDLNYNGEDSVVIGKKIDLYLKQELEGYGELISKYSIVNEVNPYLIASMIIEESECDLECTPLVKLCNNVAKISYNKDSLQEASCFGGNYQLFDSIDDSIKTYIKYIKTNFYDQELKTPNDMHKAYKKDVRWVFRVNQSMERIKNSNI